MYYRTVTHNKQYADLKFCPSWFIITKYDSCSQIKKNEWGGELARMEDRRGAYRVLVGKPGGKRSLEDLRIDGWIILNWILKKWDGEAWTGSV